MVDKIWLHRLLATLFLVGTAVAAILWGAALTARCEGFGCIGVGAMIAMTITIQLVTAVLGGILIWIASRRERIPKWLLTIETLHVLPLLWFGGRLLLS